MSRYLFAVAICASATAQNPVYAVRMRPLKTTIRIVALSSSARQVFAGSQDTYLAEIVGGGTDKAQIVKLVDRYPSYDTPIRRSVLEGQHLLKMRLWRDEGCDARADLVQLSLHQADAFNQDLVSKLSAHGAEVLPCFAIDHAATRLSK